MKQSCIIFLISLFHFYASAQKNDDSSFFYNADNFLRKYVWDGKVDYLKIKSNKSELESLVKQIAVYNIAGSSANQKICFYMNAYQILLIKNVIRHYPLSSVKEVNGFFDSYKFNVGGKKLSLNQIKYDKLLNADHDIRLLFSLSNSCEGGPLIFNTAFLPEIKLGMQLDKRINSYMNNPLFIRLDEGNKIVFISQLFNWHEPDILLNFPNLLTFINKYSREKIPGDFTVGYDNYDWTLNDINLIYSLSHNSILNSVKAIPARHISVNNNGYEESKLIYKDTVLPDLSSVSSRTDRGALFDEELGFRNESRYIESKTYELRFTDKFYTQTDVYNKQLLRVTNDFRTTYNNISLEGTYAFNFKTQGGILYNANRFYNDYSPNASATDIFQAPDNKQFHVKDLQLFAKYKWCEKKYRFSSLIYIVMPVVNKRPTDKVAINNKYYEVSLQSYYDRYPVSFMRMILSAEFKWRYSISKETASIDFNPAGRFIFPLYRSKYIKFTTMMDLLFNINKEKSNPFVAIESIVANSRICKNVDCNLMYQYYALGKNTGAGHAFKFEIRYAFQ